ncbi:metallophosphoesterase [Clostridium sp. BJN0001]|uniref:metallophosphoesterase n=1 Tax=Clostridium sp. BJN0001 TaxID=2930219 RepID=UPI001FD5E13C|nr:metallophosphoesterase [Clostridium sp. BJN0001]
MKYESKVINKILKNSAKLEIDDSSRVVFMSDCHRGDGTYNDTLIHNKNIYKSSLRYYLKNDFTLIELGDGDELWKNKSMKDISYSYSDIFKILLEFNKDERLYMVYGNHDMVKKDKNFIKKQEKILNRISLGFGKEVVELFSNINFYEGVVIKYLKNNKDIIAFHGHQVDFMNCTLNKFSRFLVRYVWKVLEGIAGFKEPVSPSNNYKKGGLIDQKLDDLSKRERVMIICGHTHNDIFPEASKSIYFNDGCIIFPTSETCIEIEEGKISLIKWSIEVSNKNVLCVKRTITKGPEKIDDYLNFAKRL